MRNVGKMTKNFIYNMLYHVFSLLTPLIVTPYITRVIDESLIGVNAVINAQVAYFCLFGTLGITTLGVRSIASINTSEKKQEINNMFWKLYFTQLFMYLLVIVAYLYFVFVLQKDHSIIYVLYLLYILSMMLDVSWFFQGMECFRYIAVRNIVIRVVSTMLIFLTVKSSGQIEVYVICLYLPQLAMNVGMMLSAIGKYHLRFRKFSVDIKTLKASALLAIPTIAISVYTILDRIILGLFRPPQDVAVYEQGQVLIRVILSVIAAWSTVVLPRLSNAINNSPKDVEILLKKSVSSVGFLMGGLFWGLLALNKPFIEIYLPEGYQFVTTILYICSPMILIVSIENIFGAQVLLSRGNDKEYTISLALAAITNCALDIIFIPMYGIVAACVSSVVAEGLAAIVQMFYCRRIVSVTLLLSVLLKHVFLGTIVFLVSRITIGFLGNGMVSIALAVGLSAAIYIFVNYLIIRYKK